MNKNLTEEIVKHIMANFLIIPSEHINQETNQPLISKEYLLNEKLTFEVDDVKIINKTYGCQLAIGEQDIKILLGNCTVEKEVPEFCLIVQLKGAPFYGMYLCYTDLLEEKSDAEIMLGCSLDGKSWMECNTYLQATFLAGMEQIKDTGLTWEKCIDYKDQQNALLSFLVYHSEIYGENENEG